MRRARLVLLALLIAAFLLPRVGADDEKPAEVTRAELKKWVKALADDDLAGREAGTPGSAVAADMITAELERLGLEPAGDDGTWFQPFTQRRGLKVEPTTTFAVTDAKGKTVALELAETFAPHDLSAKGDVTAEAVFAGYGISAPELAYDDYEGLDVKGKVVVVMRHAPAYQDRKSPFRQPAVMQKHATWQAKVDQAASRGAAALVVVNDPETFNRSSADKVKPPGGTTTGKLPVVHVTWTGGKKIQKRLGISFTRRQKQIDGKRQSKSKLLEGVTIHVKCDLVPDVRKMRNILAMLSPDGGAVTGEGETDTSKETLVVGAHYDHVGRGWFGSLAKAGGTIHNGADDNASGTAALLEIAGLLSSRRAELKRRVLIAFFDGEELGLLGSKHYAGAPKIPLAQTVAMLNLDMVGRLEKNHLMVGGTGTSPIWAEYLHRLNKERGRFKLTLWPGGRAPSDHTSFYEKDIPVLFFFTGLHGDYHRPTDDWNTLEYKGHERVARFAAEVALHVASLPERPAFTRCDAGGFRVGPYIGMSIEQRADGVYIAYVEKKSPASRGGLKAGDKLLEWNGQAVASANAFNTLLSNAKPGDKVVLVVERSGKRRKKTLKLGKT
ncbi:MAG: M28 family peptidase [Planctomycetota bacterium]|nr:M28 family peptidase [Planctomycetota bacterium]